MIDYKQITSPCFVLDEAKLEANLRKIKRIREEAGVTIILALKGFSTWHVFPMMKKYLDGATGSSLNEVMLCNDKMGSKSHTYAVAYAPSQIEAIIKGSSHLTFNSINQYHQFHHLKEKLNADVSFGLRINPEHSEVETELYNPCAPGTRLGVLSTDFQVLPEYIEGLHSHNLCENNVEALEATIEKIETKFGHILPQLKWMNFGGGHLINHKDYKIDRLIEILKTFRKKWDLEVILEPGSGIAWQTGDLVSSVLDIVENNEIKTAILNISFTCHMPDTLEMPYQPEVIGASIAKGENGPTHYRLGGLSCLAGDYLMEYKFDKPLQVGDQVIFKDQMHYTMVKTNTFNGVEHPSVAIWTKENELQIVRQYGYSDFLRKL